MPLTHSLPERKRKLSERQMDTSDSETDNSFDDDEWLIGESENEAEENSDNNVQQFRTEKNADHLLKSENESSLPLSERLDKFRKDLKWIEQCEQSSFEPIVHPFADVNAGVQSESGLNSDSNPIKIFKMFFSEDIIDIISYETNKYADEKKNTLHLPNKLKPHSRILKYTETDPDEMYAFHALILLMGIIRKPSLEMYWIKDKMLKTPFFPTVMTYNRFRQLLTMLHFSENEDDSTDKLRKVRSVYELVIENFKAVYRPGENISIDESLIPWKGRLQFKQCNRNKRACFGIKIHKIASQKLATFMI